MTPDESCDPRGETLHALRGGEPDDRRAGRRIERDPCGGVMVGAYVDGERHGVWRLLGEDGGLRAEGCYARGVMHGIWTWYRPDGTMRQRGQIVHGVTHGRWERWDAQGRARDAGYYDRGRKTGRWVTFARDGSVDAERHHDPRG